MSMDWLLLSLLEAKVLDIIRKNPGISTGKLRRILKIDKKDFYNFLNYLLAERKIIAFSAIAKTGEKYKKIYLIAGIQEEV